MVKCTRILSRFILRCIECVLSDVSWITMKNIGSQNEDGIYANVMLLPDTFMMLFFFFTSNNQEDRSYE